MVVPAAGRRSVAGECTATRSSMHTGCTGNHPAVGRDFTLAPRELVNWLADPIAADAPNAYDARTRRNSDRHPNGPVRAPPQRAPHLEEPWPEPSEPTEPRLGDATARP
jgi:hypothetical protein